MTVEQDSRPVLGPEQREVLSKLADALIPASDSMPSASQVGVPEEWVDRVLTSRPDMTDDLASLLDAFGDQEPSAAIEQLRSRQDMWFDTLCEVVAGAYFMNPKVRKSIGYPGQLELPIETSIQYLQWLTTPVVERGPIYRSCP